jgi:hypothetical protein
VIRLSVDRRVYWIRFLSLAFVVVLSGVAASGCGQAAAPPSSGVVGHVWVCVGPAPDHWQGALQYVEIVDFRHNYAVRGRTLTRNGSFSLSVRPGHYTLVLSNSPLRRPYGPKTTGVIVRSFTVKAHKKTLLNFAFETVALTPHCRSRPPSPQASYGA